MTLLAATALAVLTAFPALAAPNCATNAQVQEILTVKFKEAVIFQGVHKDGKVIIRVWINPESGSWTLTGTDAEGMTCILSEGQAGETIAYALPPGGDPT